MNLICHGDSLTLGEPDAYPPLLQSKLFVNQDLVASYENLGINGQGYNYVYPMSGSPYNLVQDISVSVIPALSSGIANWLIIWAGTNDIVLGGSTASQVFVFFTNYLSTANSLGISNSQIVVATMVPRQSGYETTRVAWNNLLVSNQVSYGYLLARLDLDPCIGVAGQQFNMLYFQPDNIHLTALGQQIVADIFQRTIYP